MDRREKSAVVTILSRYVTAMDHYNANQKLKTEIESIIARSSAQMNDCKVAFRLFGYDIASKELFDKIQEDLGDGWEEAFRLARQDDEPAEESEESIDAGVGENAEEPPKVREIVIERLKVAGEEGTRAAAIREFIEKETAMKIHEKTVGMTLYRLSKDGIARRDGQTWFFVPPKVETENPGGDTPGPFNAEK